MFRLILSLKIWLISNRIKSLRRRLFKDIKEKQFKKFSVIDKEINKLQMLRFDLFWQRYKKINKFKEI